MVPPALRVRHPRVCAEAIVRFWCSVISFRVNSSAGNVANDAHQRGIAPSRGGGLRHAAAMPRAWRGLSAVRSIAQGGEKLVKRPGANMKISASLF
jgi:hypothetical protein